MARFDEIDQYLDAGLELTVRGKVYVVPLPSAALGLWCRRIAQSAGEVTAASTPEELREAGARAAARAGSLPPLPEAEGKTFDEVMLGATHAEMIADSIPDPYLLFCAKTVYVWIVGGEEAAERFWRAGGRPEARGPANRAERRRAAKTGGTSTAEAATTPSPGSTSGTTSRRRSGRRRKTSRSPGTTS